MFPALAVERFPLVFRAVGLLLALCGAGLARSIQELRQRRAQHASSRRPTPRGGT